MANATPPWTVAQAVILAPGTSVLPSAQPPDNCTQIRVRNPSAVATVLLGLGTPGGTLVEGVDAIGIAPGTTDYLPIDTIAVRGSITTLIVDSVGGAVTPQLTYINVAGQL